MRIRWTYQLPEPGGDAPDSSGAPLHWDGRAILVPISNFEHGRERRADDPSARGYRFDVHRVQLDGRGAFESFSVSEMIIARSWSFLELGRDLVLHLGTFHSLPGGAELAAMPSADACDGVGRGVFLKHQGSLLFADGSENTVYCHDLGSKAQKWTLELPNTHSYRIGPLALYRGKLVCYGRDALNYIEPTTGSIEHQQAFAGIDKLYPPVEHEGDLLFAYTNWTSGGLLRFDPAQQRVKWKFTKRGSVAIARGGPLPVVDRTAILSLNDGSSLVGVDLNSGKAQWTFRAQWLYTPIEVVGQSIVFGTAGYNERHLRRHHAETGETEWAVQMEGGCPYYSQQGDHYVAGDWGGVFRRIRRADGKVVAQVDLGAPVCTAPLVVGNDVFALRWPSDGTSPALVAVA